MSAVPHDSAAEPDESAPIALDGLAYGLDDLDALLVFHLGDAHLHAAWVRPDAGIRAEDAVAALRDAYRVGQFAARRIAPAGAGERRGELQHPLLTLELPSRVAFLRRVRSHVVACLFDGALPLGMARMVAARLVAALEPELPLGEGAAIPGALEPLAPVIRAPRPGDVDGELERGPATLSFGSGRRRSLPPPRATAGELDRTRRLLAYLEAHAPEAHVVRHRLALRAGLTLVALDHPETLGPEALVLIETAVEDILGLDHAELRRLA